MASTAFVQTQARTDVPILFDQKYLDTFHQKFALSDRYQIMNKQTFLDWWKYMTHHHARREAQLYPKEPDILV